MDKQYWVTEPSETLAKRILEKVDLFDRDIYETGRIAAICRSMNMYYGVDSDGTWARSSMVTYGGDQGENVLVNYNHYRSLVDARNIQAMGQRPAFDAMGNNTDSDAGRQASLAKRIFEFHLSQGTLEPKVEEAQQYKGITGEGWLEMVWDANQGELHSVDPINNTPVYSGAPAFYAYPIYDVIRDVCRRDMDNDWVVTRRLVNKWDLVAMYPDKEKELVNKTFEAADYRRYIRRRYRFEKSEDFVELLTFYHKKTKAVPDGRLVMQVEDAVLLDVPLPYDTIPVFCLTENNEVGSPYGNTKNWDLIGPQQVLNSCISTIATNHEAFGLQNIIVPKGANIEATNIARGMRVLEINPGIEAPKALHLIPTSNESYRLAESAVETMETLAGINSVTRGNPPASVQSGAGMAYMGSMSATANSADAVKYIEFLEKVGTALIRLYQYFATTPHLIEVVGVDKRSSVESFTGQDLSKVRRITVSVGGPMMRTQAGRMEVANALTERWPEQIRPEHYMQLLDTGQLEPMYESKSLKALWIKKENEMLMQGKPQVALYFEDHPFHIQEHESLMMDEDFRFNPARKAERDLTMAHIQQHVSLEMQVRGGMGVNPSELQAPQGGPQQPPPPKAARAPESPNPVYDNTSGDAAKVLMPRNPATGERANPTGSNSGS